MTRDSNYKPVRLLTDRLAFPNAENANEEGLLAVGGDLSLERLMLAYKSGIFPWFNDDSPILWWCPDPRMVLFPDKIKISNSMKKVIKNKQFSLTKNACFEAVIDECAHIKRSGQNGTWITSEMKKSYLALHRYGYAVSYEVWENDFLVGGLYGVDLGHVFCGESMFSRTSNASKFAFIKLAQDCQKNKYQLIDCQVYTKHLESLGAEKMSRSNFLNILKGKNI